MIQLLKEYERILAARYDPETVRINLTDEDKEELDRIRLMLSQGRVGSIGSRQD